MAVPQRLIAASLMAVVLSFPSAARAVGGRVEGDEAELAARGWLERRAAPSAAPAVTGRSTLTGRKGATLAHVIELQPNGFVVVSANRDMPPVLAYSLTDGIVTMPEQRERWSTLLAAVVELRLSRVHQAPAKAIERHHHTWTALVRGEGEPVGEGTQFQQWPPPGTTATGGWLEHNWHQGAPYNDSCPVDPVTGERSVAGCPAVAMALIFDYHRTTNSIQLDDGDDYYHSYSGRYYRIDDDWSRHDFPSFPQLSAALDTLNQGYLDDLPASDAGSAALVFACGVTATQVYTSSVSGTFGVGQAFAAYQRFGVGRAALLDGDDEELFSRLKGNMKQALPAHLAVVDSSETSGHNLVVDGYNTDEFYHLNFGWGGSSNGWYLLPEEIPYQLTVIEGVIVDIVPGFVTGNGFESGGASEW